MATGGGGVARSRRARLARGDAPGESEFASSWPASMSCGRVGERLELAVLGVLAGGRGGGGVLEGVAGVRAGGMGAGLALLWLGGARDGLSAKTTVQVRVSSNLHLHFSRRPPSRATQTVRLASTTGRQGWQVLSGRQPERQPSSMSPLLMDSQDGVRRVLAPCARDDVCDAASPRAPGEQEPARLRRPPRPPETQSSKIPSRLQQPSAVRPPASGFGWHLVGRRQRRPPRWQLLRARRPPQCGLAVSPRSVALPSLPADHRPIDPA